jgi:hypothetical protein
MKSVLSQRLAALPCTSDFLFADFTKTFKIDGFAENRRVPKGFDD